MAIVIALTAVAFVPGRPVEEAVSCPTSLTSYNGTAVGPMDLAERATRRLTPAETRMPLLGFLCGCLLKASIMLAATLLQAHLISRIPKHSCACNRGLHRSA